MSEPSASGQLTICSVSFGCYPYLDLNWKLARATNPQANITWLVMDNAVDGDEERMPDLDDRFHVLRGFPRQGWKPSCHHARALNRLLETVETPFALILDPDFFILREHWMEEVPNHMDALGVCFFGAQWHPDAYWKMRYFPSPHCMFIDLKRVDREALDFMPADCPYGFRRHPASERISDLVQSIRAHDRYLRLIDRILVGTARDTGYRNKERFGSRAKDNREVECLQAVSTGRKGRSVRWLDHLLPDRFSLTPKRIGHVSDVSFRECGFPFDFQRHGWEEFMWKDRPFGFHVRRYVKRKKHRYDAGEDARKLKLELASILDTPEANGPAAVRAPADD